MKEFAFRDCNLKEGRVSKEEAAQTKTAVEMCNSIPSFF